MKRRTFLKAVLGAALVPPSIVNGLANKPTAAKVTSIVLGPVSTYNIYDELRKRRAIAMRRLADAMEDVIWTQSDTSQSNPFGIHHFVGQITQPQSK